MSSSSVSPRAGRSALNISFRRVGISATVLVAAGLVTLAQVGAESTLGPAATATAPVRAAESYDGPLSFEDRVRYQRRIEEVYWRHRIWPAENPGPRPALDDLLPDAVIRERVATYLEKSAALEIFWSRPLTGEQLQAEMNRMARESRDSGMLRELYAALDDDPFLVSECLARPVLVDRLIRNRYARDARFHGALRKRAESALETHPKAASRMRDLGGKYSELEWRLDGEEAIGANRDPVSAEQTVIELTTEQWRERISRIAGSHGIARPSAGTDDATALLDGIPTGRISPLVETDDRFLITALLWIEPDRIRVASVTWSKRPFGRWWNEEARAAVNSVGRLRSTAPPIVGYELPSIRGGGCAADTWTERWYAPASRSHHAAVWTGAEMIVWGGVVGTTEFDSGGRYDPATDSWRPTSQGTDVPSARAGHAAVWTGTVMIVWGGTDRWGADTGYLDTGGRYDPLSDSWTATSMGSGVPSARRYHTAVWTGTEMIVWGGYDSQNPLQPLDTGGRYDPATDSWTATSLAGAPAARCYHAAVWTGTEMIVWGGVTADYMTVSTGGRYDPLTDSWTATSLVGAAWPLHWHEAVWTGEKMIVWGGWDFFGEQWANSGGVYDPLTDSWFRTSTVGAPSRRYRHTAVWTGAEMIIWGGGGSGGNSLTNTGGRYDPGTDSWTPTSTTTGVPTRSGDHTAVWTGTEMIVWGGVDSGDAQDPLDLGGRYDPMSDSWTPTSTGVGVPVGREHHTAVWTGAEMIVWGGRQFEGGTTTYFGTGGRYDPAIDNWSETSTGIGAPTPRYAHTAVWTGTEMVVWGGYVGGGVTLDTGGRYDPGTDSWTGTSTGAGVPTGRQFHSAIWTGTEMIVWGGAADSSGGRYDPATDSWTATSMGAGVPAKRYISTAVWTGTKMIVWGGRDGDDRLNTGGLYDPATDSWAPTSVGAAVPEARDWHTAVWTGTEMIVWGGYHVEFPLSTGGRYDPETDSWTATSTDAPEGRLYHTAVWTGTEMIVWGGFGFVSGLPTGGRYDPVTDIWTAMPTASGKNSHTAIWTGTEMVVWGGESYTGYHDNTLLYCACEGGTVGTWYPDADGDGFGVESTGLPSCSQPPGYVAVGGDCDDTSYDTYPGAFEINDGLDNQCPGDDGHGVIDEISGVTGFHNREDENELSWTPQAGAVSYEVARSANGQFVTDCETWLTAEAFWIDTDPLPAGGRYHYLVRAALPNAGSWGWSSAGVERTWVCP